MRAGPPADNPVAPRPDNGREEPDTNGAWKRIAATGLLAVAVVAAAGCGQTDQAVCDDVRLLEEELASVQSRLQPEVIEEVRDDYAEMATDANCPGYDNADD